MEIRSTPNFLPLPPGEFRPRNTPLPTDSTFGDKVESFLNRFVEQAFDPIPFAGFALGSVAFAGTRLWSLARLLRYPFFRGSVVGLGAARSLSATVGVAAEGLAISLGTKAARHVWEGPQNWMPPVLGKDLFATGISLGFLRFSGAFSQGSLAYLFSARISGGARVPFKHWEIATQFLLPQAAMFTGMVLSTQTQMALGLRPRQVTLDILKESLTTLLHFNVAGNLFERLQPRGMGRDIRNLHRRAEQLLAHYRKATKPWGIFLDRKVLTSSVPALAGIPNESLHGMGKGLWEKYPLKAGHFQMTRKPNPDQGGTPPAPSPKISGILPSSTGPREIDFLKERISFLEKELQKTQVLLDLQHYLAGSIHNFKNSANLMGLFFEGYLPTLFESYRRIHGNTEELAEMDAIAARCRDFLGHATQEMSFFQKFIVGMRTAEAGEPIPLKKWMAETLDYVLLFSKHYPVKISASSPPQPIFIRGNYGVFSQAILNLIKNSVQAMPRGGEINLTLYKEESQVHLEIRDTGEGIRPEVLKKIFEPYFTTKAAGKGTGLGMFMVKTVVEKVMSGEIQVESEIGKGTTVKMIFPEVPPPKNEESSSP